MWSLSTEKTGVLGAKCREVEAGSNSGRGYKTYELCGIPVCLSNYPYRESNMLIYLFANGCLLKG